MSLLDLLDLLGSEFGDTPEAQRSSDDRCGGRGNAVLGEGRVVRRGISRQMINKVLTDGYGELVTCEVLAAERQDVSGMQRLEVHQLVSHLVVVLECMDQ